MSRTYRDPNREPCRLAPLEAFSDELAENGLAARVQPHHQPRCGRGINDSQRGVRIAVLRVPRAADGGRALRRDAAQRARPTASARC